MCECHREEDKNFRDAHQVGYLVGLQHGNNRKTKLQTIVVTILKSSKVMKKIKIFGLASTLILAGAAGFTSCSSDSADPIGGGTGVAGQVVKTQFYINIPYKGNDTRTRMTDVNTQNKTPITSANFLGMEKTQLFAFKGEPNTGTFPSSIKAISIGDAADASSKEEWRCVYRDIAISVGTKNLLLYARAKKGTKTDFEAGSLSNPYNGKENIDVTNLSELNFELTSIHEANDFNTKGEAILKALNQVANTQVDKGDGTMVKWSEIVTSDLGTNNERQSLQERYKKFTSLTSGSAKSVKLLIEDLKTVINGNGLEAGKLMANAIVNNCTQALSDLDISPAKDFPRDINLPDGVAKVKWNPTTEKFQYVAVSDITGTAHPGAGNLIDYTTITYPSELAYYVSSPVKVSTDEITAVSGLPKYDEWINNTADWSAYGNEVQNSTRFVALEKPVLYGVACLNSTVKCASSTLKDNAKTAGNYDVDNDIKVDDTSFPITGILIGGQPKQVSWNFEAANTVSSTDFKYTVYDRDMNNPTNLTAAVSGTPLSNYTLVLDNKDNSGTTQSSVYITIELENNASSFFGAEGLIPKGSKFYMVGVLNPKATSGITQPTGKTLDHVFVKDHTTVANFTIQNLKKAYNHIPDMRSSKINVGLAVDLTWKDGITFDVDL